MGGSFPKGSSASYDGTKSILTVNNIPHQIEKSREVVKSF